MTNFFYKYQNNLYRINLKLICRLIIMKCRNKVTNLIICATILICIFGISASYDSNHLFICNQYTCSPSNGKCGRDNECICAYGYITVTDEKFGNFHCNYKMKSQVKAFLLEFLIGFGIGHFYIGNITIALTKLLYSSLTCYIICQLPSFEKINSVKKCAYYFQLILGLGWAAWQITDSVLIAMNRYKDENGVSLRPW